MLELPKHGEGLDWVVSQGTSQLLLIPRLQPASIIAAAAGDAEALAYLRFTAQHHVALGIRNHTAFDEVCCAAPGLASSEQLQNFCKKFEDSEKLYQVYAARLRFTMDVMLKAVAGGRLAALQWLRALCHATPNSDQAMIESAASHGQLGVLKHLCSRPGPIPWPDSILTLAAGHADCLEWLLLQEPSCPWDDKTLGAVAAAGNLSALQHLRRHHQKYMPLTAWNKDVGRNAARHGHLAVLQWLRSQEPAAPWGPSTIGWAATKGQLGVMSWLRDQGCPWDSSAVKNAARVGRLETLRWLRAQVSPCPWSQNCTAAAAKRDLATLQWLLDQAPPCPLHPDCPKFAACCGDLPMLKLLSRHGCMPTWDDYHIAAEHGHVHILRWLRQKKVLVPEPAHFCARILGCSICHVQGDITTNTPVLLFLGEIGALLHPKQQKQLVLTRKACCTFYGLVRWCRLAVSDPSKGIHRAFDTLLTDASGQSLLVRLSMLPPEILNRIALAAGLRHTLFEESDADDPVYPAWEQQEQNFHDETSSEDE